LLLGAGLGNMVPDTVAMVLPESETELASGDTYLPVDSVEEFVQVSQDVIHLKKNLLIAANFGSASSAAPGARGRVDIWMIGNLSAPVSGVGEGEFELVEMTQMSLLLQMGMICHTTNEDRPQLRLLHCLPGDAQPDGATLAQENVLRQWLRWARIPHADVKVIKMANGPNHLDAESCESDFVAVNEEMRRESGDATTVLAMLPPLPTTSQAPGVLGATSNHCYWKNVCALAAGLPPTVLAMNGQGFPVITSVI